MKKSSPTGPKSKARKILSIISWVIFGGLSALILTESATASDSSARQSNIIARIITDFINGVTPGKEAAIVKPSGITLKTDQAYQGEDTAVLGTTRMISYWLDGKEGAVLDAQVSIERKDGSTDEDYTLSLTQVSNGGYIRILPYRMKDHCSFSITDSAGESVTYAFDVVDRIAPEHFDFVCPVLKVGQGIPLEGVIPEDDGGRDDDYLRRFFNPSLIDWSVSDPAVLTLDLVNGVLKASAPGTAQLLMDGSPICEVQVSNEPYEIPSDFSFEGATTVHALDYDYPPLGSQFTATCDNPDELFVYRVDDEMTARVLSDRYGSEGIVRGGLVRGYRLQKDATLKIYPASNPSIAKTVTITNEVATAVDAVSFSIASGSAPHSSDSFAVESGTRLTISADFQPQNTINKNLVVTTSDAGVVSLSSGRGLSIVATAKNKGKATIHVEAEADPSYSKDYVITVNLMPTIDKAGEARIQQVTRKALGHFGLFLFTATWGMLAFLLSVPHAKLKYLWNSLEAFGAGLILAFGSEGIQTIPALKRSGEVKDALIDMAGFLVGMAIVLLVYFLIDRAKKKKAEANPPEEEKIEEQDQP